MAKNVDTGNGSLPLKDVVLCSTSLPQDARTRLAEAAAQMGASHKLDLTGDVTHLLVGDIDTPKYKYVAKERPDVCVLHPDWVEAVKAAWMEGGDDVDVRALERQHRYPTFAGLKICMTGITDTTERMHIENTVKQNGAEYHGDLTRDITHLIVAKPEGAKYRAARDWGGVKPVSIKWFHDCLRRGMVLEASFYDPTMATEEQGIGAFRDEPRTRTTLGKRPREDETPAAPANDGGKRKLRRTASRKLEGHSQDVWQNISSVRDSILPPPENDQWNAGNDESQLTLGREEPGPESRRQSIAADQGAHSAPTKPEGLFSGWYIFIDGFEKDRTKKLTKVLDSSGAILVSRLQDLDNASNHPRCNNRCLLVPHSEPSRKIDLGNVRPGTAIATEWWVERCIHNKTVTDPETDELSRPLWDLPMDDLGGLVISITGFAGVDFRQTAEAIKMSGATYQDNILPTISVLVSGSTTVRKEKAFYATKHGIPVVSAAWLWSCFRNKRKVPVDQYKLQLPAFDPGESMGNPSTSSPAPSDPLRTSTGASRKDATAPSRLSNTRKRQATPSLLMQAPQPASRTTQKKGGPFVHEDEDARDSPPPAVDIDLPTVTDQPALSPRRSQPLQEVSPNASPLRSTHAHKRESGETNESEPPVNVKTKVAPSTTSPEEVQSIVSAPATEPSKQTETDHAATLASLLSNRHSHTSPAEPVQRLKCRKLGRAPSGSNLMSRSLSGSTGAAADEGEDGEDRRSSGPQQPELPSTQLGYEAPESEQARLQMAKRMGTSFNDDTVGRRVEKVGMVKDAATSSGGGGGARAARSRQRK